MQKLFLQMLHFTFLLFLSFWCLKYFFLSHIFHKNFQINTNKSKNFTNHKYIFTSLLLITSYYFFIMKKSSFDRTFNDHIYSFTFSISVYFINNDVVLFLIRNLLSAPLGRPFPTELVWSESTLTLFPNSLIQTSETKEKKKPEKLLCVFLGLRHTSDIVG